MWSGGWLWSLAATSSTLCVSPPPGSVGAGTHPLSGISVHGQLPPCPVLRGDLPRCTMTLFLSSFGHRKESPEEAVPEFFPSIDPYSSPLCSGTSVLVLTVSFYGASRASVVFFISLISNPLRACVCVRVRARAWSTTEYSLFGYDLSSLWSAHLCDVSYGKMDSDFSPPFFSSSLTLFLPSSFPSSLSSSPPPSLPPSSLLPSLSSFGKDIDHPRYAGFETSHFPEILCSWEMIY